MENSISCQIQKLQEVGRTTPLPHVHQTFLAHVESRCKCLQFNNKQIIHPLPKLQTICQM